MYAEALLGFFLLAIGRLGLACLEQTQVHQIGGLEQDKIGYLEVWERFPWEDMEPHVLRIQLQFKFVCVCVCVCLCVCVCVYVCVRAQHIRLAVEVQQKTYSLCVCASVCVS